MVKYNYFSKNIPTKIAYIYEFFLFLIAFIAADYISITTHELEELTPLFIIEGVLLAFIFMLFLVTPMPKENNK